MVPSIRKKKSSHSRASEAAIQKLILDWLTAKKFYHWRNYIGAVLRSSGGRIGFSKNPARGMPDIMGLMKDGSGRLFAIEVKTSKGKIGDHQQERIDALEKNGAMVFVARDLNTVIKILEGRIELGE